MNVKTELIKRRIADFLAAEHDMPCIEEIAEHVRGDAISVLQDIQNVLRSESCSDFDAVEEIVCIFEKHGLDAGSRHDF